MPPLLVGDQGPRRRAAIQNRLKRYTLQSDTVCLRPTLHTDAARMPSAPRPALVLLLGLCGCQAHTPARAITERELGLSGDPLFPQTSAFAPGMVAWVTPGEDTWVALALQEGRHLHTVDFEHPQRLGGGLGIVWYGQRTAGADEEMCIAMPDIRCAPLQGLPKTTILEVSTLDGQPAVWSRSGWSVDAGYQLLDEVWVPIALPDEVIQGHLSSVLPSEEGLVVKGHGGLLKWTREAKRWVATPLPFSASGSLVLSPTHLIWYASPLPRLPERPLGPHPDPEPGQLHRVALDGSGSTEVSSHVGLIQHIAPHGETGTLIIGMHQSEYWQEEALIWRLPAGGMSGGIWAGSPWVTLGQTRMRLDGPAIEVVDPTPGRVTWGARASPEIVDCGDGLGLEWHQGDRLWRAWVSRGRVRIGHTCPARVDRWPRGEVGSCTGGTRLEREDHTACVETVSRLNTRTIMQLGRAP